MSVGGGGVPSHQPPSATVAFALAGHFCLMDFQPPPTRNAFLSRLRPGRGGGPPSFSSASLPAKSKPKLPKCTCRTSQPTHLAFYVHTWRFEASVLLFCISFLFWLSQTLRASLHPFLFINQGKQSSPSFGDPKLNMALRELNRIVNYESQQSLYPTQSMISKVPPSFISD